MENNQDNSLKLDQLSLEQLNDLIKSSSDESLATRVVIYRLLGLQKSLAILCMQELEKRRLAGNTFDFNSYIQEALDQSPKPEINKKNMSLISNLLKMNNNGK